MSFMRGPWAKLWCQPQEKVPARAVGCGPFMGFIHMYTLTWPRCLMSTYNASKASCMSTMDSMCLVPVYAEYCCFALRSVRRTHTLVREALPKEHRAARAYALQSQLHKLIFPMSSDPLGSALWQVKTRSTDCTRNAYN